MKNSLLKVADIHVERIQHSKNELEIIFPLTSSSISNLGETDLLNIEMLSSRFAKLQDLIGTKIIDYYLNMTEESILGLTMRDKLNRLEKLGIIDNASIWTKLREIRNHLAHEYPDDPELTANHLNRVFTLSDERECSINCVKVKIMQSACPGNVDPIPRRQVPNFALAGSIFY